MREARQWLKQLSYNYWMQLRSPCIAFSIRTPFQVSWNDHTFSQQLSLVLDFVFRLRPRLRSLRRTLVFGKSSDIFSWFVTFRGLQLRRCASPYVFMDFKLAYWRNRCTLQRQEQVTMLVVVLRAWMYPVVLGITLWVLFEAPLVLQGVTVRQLLAKELY